MKQFIDFMGDQTYPVIEFRRAPKYESGEKTNIMESRYTVFCNYEKFTISVEDDGMAVTKERVKEAADNGTPIEMSFKNLELTISATREPWVLRVSGHASQALSVKGK